MATYHGKHYDPDFIDQDTYEWLTETGPYANSRVAIIRRKLNELSVLTLNARQYTEKALAYMRLVAPGSVAITALETVLEVLEHRTDCLCFRADLLDTYPRSGSSHLVDCEVNHA